MYNSLNADMPGDFGYGWSLREADYQLSVDMHGNAWKTSANTSPLEGGDRVIVTLSDGTEEGFKFEPHAVS